MIQISIPKPCYQNWETMQPGDHGRDCSACATTVIDFTGMDDETVRQYLMHNKQKNTCGRFRNDQLSLPIIQLPENILQLQLPKWKRFLTACLFAFSSMLFSCETRVTMGQPVPIDKKDSVAEFHQYRDEPVVVGNFQAVYAVTVKDEPEMNITQPDFIATQEEFTTGIIDIIMIPPHEEKIGVLTIDSSKYTQDCIDSSGQQTNPPLVDSINCDSRKYY